MLLVQEYLETHTFDDLIKDHGVYASFSKSGHKWSLNYDQIEAKESDPLAQECRGLVLSSIDGKALVPMEIDGKLSYNHICPGKTEVLAFPMRRFFNYGQGSAAEINWHDKNLSILEKLDGTLCIVYFDKFTDKWCVATRSVPEADLFMDNGIFTFRTLFEKALYDTTHGLPFDQFEQLLDKNYTYCFELTTPYNRIVVYYPDCRITLLAARKMSSFKEVDPNKVAISGIPVVQAHTYTSIDDLVNWVSSLNPMEHEGVVVRDSDFSRIKVKNAAYVAYNKVRDALGTSERNCVELILAEKDDDVIAMLPEDIVKNLQRIKDGVREAIKHYDQLYLNLKKQADAILLGDKKTFALLVNAQEDIWPAPLFQIFDGRASNMHDFIAKARKDGSWGNNFLDKFLWLSNKFNK